MEQCHLAQVDPPPSRPVRGCPVSARWRAAALWGWLGAIAISMLAIAAPARGQPSHSPVASDALGLLQQAQTAQRQARHSEAEILWRQLVTQWPNSAELSYSLGLSLHRQFKIEEAAQAYVTATVLNPNHREAHINLSLARIQLGELDAAMEPLDRVLALPDRPSSPASIHTLAHYNRAVILGRQSQVEAALAAVNQALTITPDFQQATELIDLIR